MILSRFLILSILHVCSLCDWYHNTKATEINSDNIDQLVGLDKHVILDFFTPWCIYCQWMANDWNSVKEHYNGPDGVRNSDLLIAKMNCGEQRNHEICHNYGVYAYPTIIHIEPKQMRAAHQFHGNRQYREFLHWIDDVCEKTQVQLEEDIKLKEQRLQDEIAEELRKVEEFRKKTEQLEAEKIGREKQVAEELKKKLKDKEQEDQKNEKDSKHPKEKDHKKKPKDSSKEKTDKHAAAANDVDLSEVKEANIVVEKNDAIDDQQLSVDDKTKLTDEKIEQKLSLVQIQLDEFKLQQEKIELLELKLQGLEREKEKQNQMDSDDKEKRNIKVNDMDIGQIQQINWKHGMVFIIIGVILGILVSFILGFLRLLRAFKG